MKHIKIGLAFGINPSVSLTLKAMLIAAGIRRDIVVDIVESDEEVRTDAPDAYLAAGDRMIAAYRAARALDLAGCASAVVADVRTEPFLKVVQDEVEVPLVSLYGGVAAECERKGAKCVGILGSAVPREFFVKLLEGKAEVLELSEELLEAYRTIQDPKTGLRGVGLTEDLKARIVAAGEKLVADGAELLIFACGQMARFAADLKAAGLPVFDMLEDTAERIVAETPARLGKPFKVGLVGGLGPAATVDLYDKITRFTPAARDQEHIKVVVEQNPQTPDRTAALLADGPDPTLALYSSALRLEEDGCDAIIIPCNTAHAFLPRMERGLKTPFINMQQVTMEEIAEKLGEKARIGLLATTGTVRTGIYARRAEAMGMPLFTPDEAHQALVMEAIYGPKGVKAGFTTGQCREDLLCAAAWLVENHDCNVLILGCTELPLILDESDAFEVAGKSVVITDPTSALARRVVKIAMEARARTHRG